jgi:hypothetical protein
MRLVRCRGSFNRCTGSLWARIRTPSTPPHQGGWGGLDHPSEVSLMPRNDIGERGMSRHKAAGRHSRFDLEPT